MSMNEKSMKIFMEKLVREIEAKTSYKPDIVEVEKVNLGKLHGIVLRTAESKKKKSEAYPTIYIDSYGEEYISKKKKMGQIVAEILNINEYYKIKNNTDISWILDYEKVKSLITYRIINLERNTDFLKTVPHKEFLDLAVVYYIDCRDFTRDIIGEKDLASAVICIKNSLFESWGIDISELDTLAKSNTQRLNPVKIENLIERTLRIVFNIPDEIPVPYRQFKDKKEPETYILSNISGIQGASCILYDGLLESISDLVCGNFFILPSSVHEVLILSCNTKMSKEELKTIVKEINRTVLSADDYLSDSVYGYNCQNKELSLVL